MILAALLLLGFCPAAVAGDSGTGRFQLVDKSIVVDSQTGLMWAAQDNGKDIDWWEAKKYCAEFRAGGYADWRLPEIKELATLYTHDQINNDGYAIPGPFKLSACCIWSSYDTMGGALVLNFKTGNKTPNYLADKYALRALPVRGTSKVDLHKYRTFMKDK